MERRQGPQKMDPIHSLGKALTPRGAVFPKFDTLTRCGDEVWIENNGQVYRLRRTRQGKLILTK
jgi:hemin uptake protein HemP